MLEKHLNLLGFKVIDRVTGFTGVVTSISFDLYGCIQAVINPGVDSEGMSRDSQWFDLNRLVATSAEPVMDRPNWTDSHGPINGDRGPAEKPLHLKP